MERKLDCKISTNTKKEPTSNRLWIVEYSIKDIGNGCAVVKAHNANEVTSMLRNQGIFNGTPHLYSITRIEEIIESPDSMIICEQIATNNKDLN